jgi:hypothetical protein
MAVANQRRTPRRPDRIAGHAAVFVAIAVLVAACGGGPGGANGGSPLPGDACSLLSSAEVSLATGYTAGLATHPSGSDNGTCEWDGPTDSAGKAQSVRLVLDPGANHYNASAGGAVMGVGDAAYLNSSNGWLYVKVGSNAFWVADSSAPSDDAFAIETTLAKIVVAEL